MSFRLYPLTYPRFFWLLVQRFTHLLSFYISIAPEARARLNAVYILSVCRVTSDFCLNPDLLPYYHQLFIGQVTGTSAGTFVFNRYGWRASTLMTLGFAVWQILILLLRGPGLDPPGTPVSKKRWIGWDGAKLEWKLSRGKEVKTETEINKREDVEDLEKGIPPDSAAPEKGEEDSEKGK